MKAVILIAGAAGPPRPKCLYHVNGEMILMSIIQALKGAGVTDIRAVVGYKKEEIEKFNEEQDLGMELVYNPKWATDSVESMRTGLQGVNEDVLLVHGDIILRRDVVEGFLKCEKPLCCIKNTPHTPDKPVFPWDGKYQICIIKIAKNRLNIFDKAQEYADRYARRKGSPTPWISGWGVVFGGAIIEILRAHLNDVGGVVSDYIPDIDFFDQTDEGKQ